MTLCYGQTFLMVSTNFKFVFIAGRNNRFMTMSGSVNFECDQAAHVPSLSIFPEL